MCNISYILLHLSRFAFQELDCSGQCKRRLFCLYIGLVVTKTVIYRNVTDQWNRWGMWLCCIVNIFCCLPVHEKFVVLAFLEFLLFPSALWLKVCPDYRQSFPMASTWICTNSGKFSVFHVRLWNELVNYRYVILMYFYVLNDFDIRFWSRSLVFDKVWLTFTPLTDYLN